MIDFVDKAPDYEISQKLLFQFFENKTTSANDEVQTNEPNLELYSHALSSEAISIFLTFIAEFQQLNRHNVLDKFSYDYINLSEDILSNFVSPEEILKDRLREKYKRLLNAIGDGQLEISDPINELVGLFKESNLDDELIDTILSEPYG